MIIVSLHWWIWRSLCGHFRWPAEAKMSDRWLWLASIFVQDRIQTLTRDSSVEIPYYNVLIFRIKHLRLLKVGNYNTQLQKTPNQKIK